MENCPRVGAGHLSGHRPEHRKHYVGKADGEERLLGCWTAYARDGHGGNIALRELRGIDAEHSRHFQWSVLRVFSPSTPQVDVDQAEAHHKRALLTRQFGLNRNWIFTAMPPPIGWRAIVAA